jgi:hypothetical protein
MLILISAFFVSAGYKEIVVEDGYFYLFHVDWQDSQNTHDNDWNTWGEPIDGSNHQPTVIYYSAPPNLIQGTYCGKFTSCE